MQTQKTHFCSEEEIKEILDFIDELNLISNSPYSLDDFSNSPQIATISKRQVVKSLLLTTAMAIWRLPCEEALIRWSAMDMSNRFLDSYSDSKPIRTIMKETFGRPFGP